MNIDKINGYGVILRFITPILISIIIFILSGIKCDIQELKAHFGNHLSEHKGFDKEIFERITSLEAKINK